MTAKSEIMGVVNNKLFVGNLPSSMSGFSLKTLFVKFGEITELDIISESSTGRSRRFSFITFASAKEAGNAQSQMNKKDCEGLRLSVRLVDTIEQVYLIKNHHEKLPIYH